MTFTNFLRLIILSTLSSASVLAVGVKEIPNDIVWQTTDPVKEGLIASPKAKRGGSFNDYLRSFPLTLRQVGPDSNGSFRGYMDENDVSLLVRHPNTNAWLPGIATHWAKDKNGRTMYYRLDPQAKWSDGKPITADDFLFMLELYRSPHIVHPWYNQYFTDEVEAIQKFKSKDGKDLLAVTLPKPKPDLEYFTNFRPFPKHFYKLDKNFVKAYNWKPPPTSGPYYIDKVRKGKTITFKRVKDWWGDKRPWFQNRFSFDKVQFQVIRDRNTAFEYFTKQKLDYINLNYPDLWHERTNTPDFLSGRIKRLWFYNDRPRYDYVLTLNTKHPIFQDKRVREALHYSMNVDKVINQVLRKDYQRLQAISRGYGDYTNETLKARPFDLKKADELLSAAGWTKRDKNGYRVKDGQTLEATLTYRDASVAKRFVVLREEAKKAGFNIKLQLLDSSSGWKYFRDGKTEIAYVVWATFHRPQYWSQYHSSNANKTQTNNFSNLADPELDKLIESYRASTKHEERTKAAQKIQKFIHDAAVQIPLFEIPYFRVGYWNWIKFPKVQATKESDTLKYFGLSTGGLMWLDKEQKKKTKAEAKQKKPGQPIIEKNETFRRKT
ncbi:MAG: ABC transporter substrate-binding protein [Pseudobacteriovorax sp.]|nr:ABC transporter substrate-binding protein [Pseudobacteriovorax sp.]